MKKIICLTLVSFFVFTKSEAQTFYVVGNDSMIQNIVANDISLHDIWLQNNTFADDTLAYQVTQTGIMNGWDASLCVNGNCQIGIPLSGVMAPIAAAQQGLMGFNVNPYYQFGTSTLELKVWDIHDTTSQVTLFWQLTLQPNEVNNFSSHGFQVSMFPNPVLNEFRISDFAFHIGDAVSIYNVSGEKVFTKNISAEENSIDVSDLSNGFFFLEIKNSSGEISRGKFVKQ